MAEHAPHIVVLGAGFGGLTFCQCFHEPRARLMLVDRQNHHLFQPLLYQVASAGLSAPDIAQPIRSILSDKPNVTVLLDEVVDFDLSLRRVRLTTHTVEYDYLILALGGQTGYFGHPEWEEFAPGLKTLDDALRIRREILLALEEAENESDPVRLEQLLTTVIVGGGPTGVELAGAFAELTKTVLKKDFRRIDPTRARIILLEGGARVLPQFSEHLSQRAREQLAALGVEVRTDTRVLAINRGRVQTDHGEILAENIIWAAGVAASPLAQKLGVPLDRAGRIKVEPDLSLPGHPEIFALGDLALVLDERSQPVPGVAPAAMQMAGYVARLIEAELNSGRRPGRPFAYWDKGTMATIGRSSGVAKFNKLEVSGLLAWLGWLGIHLIFLIGFRNRVSVMLNWTYSYFTYRRGSRIITGLAEARRSRACRDSASSHAQ